jgi:hypothetical protein
MRGLDPRIHHLRKTLSKRMDCRVKPGNDASIWNGPGSAAHRYALRCVRGTLNFGSASHPRRRQAVDGAGGA